MMGLEDGTGLMCAELGRFSRQRGGEEKSRKTYCRGSHRHLCVVYGDVHMYVYLGVLCMYLYIYVFV